MQNMCPPSALTGEKRKFLALQLEQDPDLLMKGPLCLLAVPLPLSREQQCNTGWDRVSHQQESLSDSAQR